jgi:hypothetical protein
MSSYYSSMVYKAEVVMFCFLTYCATLFTPCYFVPVFFLGFMVDKLSSILYLKMKQQMSHYLTMVFGDVSELQHVDSHKNETTSPNALVDAAAAIFGPDVFEKGVGSIMAFFQEVQSQAVVNQQIYRERADAAIQAHPDTESDSSDSDGEETKKSD